MKIPPIDILITRACEPTLHEPNYALHLEVAEYINQKKANKLSLFLLDSCMILKKDQIGSSFF